MSIYLLSTLVGAAMVANIAAAIALRYNRIKTGTQNIITLLSAAVMIGIAVSSIWASLDNSRAFERFNTQLESIRVRTADIKQRADANMAALLRAGESPQASSPAERQRVLDLVKEASELEAEGRRLRNEIDNIRHDRGEALWAKERNAFWRAVAIAVALLPLVPLLYRRHSARQRAIEERNGTHRPRHRSESAFRSR